MGRDVSCLQVGCGHPIVDGWLFCVGHIRMFGLEDEMVVDAKRQEEARKRRGSGRGRRRSGPR